MYIYTNTGIYNCNDNPLQNIKHICNGWTRKNWVLKYIISTHKKQPMFTVDKWMLHKRNTSSYIVTRLSVMQPLDCKYRQRDVVNKHMT